MGDKNKVALSVELGIFNIKWVIHGEQNQAFQQIGENLSFSEHFQTFIIFSFLH